jgi:hypothetical protein
MNVWQVEVTWWEPVERADNAGVFHEGRQFTTKEAFVVACSIDHALAMESLMIHEIPAGGRHSRSEVRCLNERDSTRVVVHGS